MADRLLPSKGGEALLLRTIERESRNGDYIVIALSSEDGGIAEYTHCATAEQAADVLVRYHRMPEVSDAFTLHRFDIDDSMKEHAKRKGVLSAR